MSTQLFAHLCSALMLALVFFFETRTIQPLNFKKERNAITGCQSFWFSLSLGSFKILKISKIQFNLMKGCSGLQGNPNLVYGSARLGKPQKAGLAIDLGSKNWPYTLSRIWKISEEHQQFLAISWRWSWKPWNMSRVCCDLKPCLSWGWMWYFHVSDLWVCALVRCFWWEAPEVHEMHGNMIYLPCPCFAAFCSSICPFLKSALSSFRSIPWLPVFQSFPDVPIVTPFLFFHPSLRAKLTKKPTPCWVSLPVNCHSNCLPFVLAVWGLLRADLEWLSQELAVRWLQQTGPQYLGDSRVPLGKRLISFSCCLGTCAMPWAQVDTLELHLCPWTAARLALEDFDSATRLVLLVPCGVERRVTLTHVGARVGTSATAVCESVLTQNEMVNVYKCLLHLLFQVLWLFCKRWILQ